MDYKKTNASNTTTNGRIDSLNGTKLDITDQRYNETLLIIGMNNLTIEQVAVSIGNWSGNASNYYTKAQVEALGNLTNYYNKTSMPVYNNGTLGADENATINALLASNTATAR